MDQRPAVSPLAAGPRPEPTDGLTVSQIDWQLATTLPDTFAATWRDPAAWRALYEARRAGQRYLELPGLLAPAAAQALREAVLGLPWRRLVTELVSAERHLLTAHDVPAWLDVMQGETFRALVAGVLGRVMPEGLVVNAWRMRHGDHMGVHPDGRLYYGTLSLGLSEAWQPSDGGAIAFGERTADGGFAVHQRWYPRLGDACVFAPAADTWHAVEPVTSSGVRHSLTGWWTLPEDGLTRAVVQRAGDGNA